MRLKRTSQRTDKNESSPTKKSKIASEVSNDDYFATILGECGLTVNRSPEKCITSHVSHVIVRNLKRNLQKHKDYPSNVSEFISNFQDRCQDLTDFKHYLFPNIVRNPSESCAEISTMSVSIVKILLRVPILQNKLIDFIFTKATDLASDSKCGPWIQMILKCLSALDYIVDSNKMAINLIDLFDVAHEDIVRLEIITAIPDIIGDQAHENIAAEMTRIMSEHYDLIPAVLDCLSYLCLSSEQYERLQKKTLSILKTLPKCNNFANFVKFLLIPARTTDNVYLEVVEELRNALCWSTSIDKPEETVTSQILTATAIRNSMISSKVIANAWLKAVSLSKSNIDYKPINFVIMILYSTLEEKHQRLENVIRPLIKNNIMNEELIDKAFENFKPIIRGNIKHLISLTNTLLKVQAEPVIQNFASHIYTLIFSKLEGFGQTIVAELLQLGLNYKQCVPNILSILNKVALKDISVLKPQSVQMLTLLDRMDDMTLPEIRAVMNLICGLAYSCENSSIRDDIHIIIRKQLASSNSTIKMHGILAGLHAVKYLMMTKDDEDKQIDDTNHFIDGDVKEAIEIIELISNSTRQLPDMIAFFYDEFSKILISSSYINKYFLHWITNDVTNELNQNFRVKEINHEIVNDIKLDMQYGLNTDSEIKKVLAINIGGATMNVLILSPLFQLVQILHIRKKCGDVSKVVSLLECPVVMPVFDLDFIEDMSESTVCYILDCLLHCCNWFRELVNAFSFHNDFTKKYIDEKRRVQIFTRISHICKLENLISQILLKLNFTYKPPAQLFNFIVNNNDHFRKNNTKKQNILHKNPKRTTQDDSFLPETLKSQSTHIVIRNKIGYIHIITFRPLSLNILNLLSDKMAEDEESEMNLDNSMFLLKCINCNLENVLISRVKKNTFLSKQHITEPYNAIKAKEYAQSVHEIIPKLIGLIKFITSHLDKSLDNEEEIVNNRVSSEKRLKLSLILECIFNMLTIYFKWIGFKSQNSTLLEKSLCSITTLDKINSMFLKKLILSVVQHFHKLEKYCFQLSTAVSLVDIISALQEHSPDEIITKILRDMARHFLSQEWKNASGVLEKGIIYNQSIDNFLKIYLINVELPELKNIVLLLINDIEVLKDRNSTLISLKCINKANIPILYKNLVNTLLESTKTFLSKGLTNWEHLELWSHVAFILKCLSDLAKGLEMRTIYIAFFKTALPIIKLFLSKGIPILELEFKSKKTDIHELLKTLQQSTRFLHSLCHHFKIKKDKAVLSKVPYMKQLLETLICKFKTVLVANDSSDEFLVGVLKNKNIQGEVIPTQQSIESQDSADICEDQSLEDESDDADNEIMQPDSESASAIL